MARTGFRKFGNIPAEYDGIRFDSQREMARYAALRLLEKGGMIRDLRRQVRIPLHGRDGPLRFPSKRTAVYVADFVYFDIPKGVEVIEDSKGFETAEFKLKRAILAAQGITVVVT